MSDTFEISADEIWFRAWRLGSKPADMPATIWDDVLSLLNCPTEDEREAELASAEEIGREEAERRFDEQVAAIERTHQEALDTAYAEGYAMRARDALAKRRGQ
jgi:hypothetical protein